MSEINKTIAAKDEKIIQLRASLSRQGLIVLRSNEEIQVLKRIIDGLKDDVMALRKERVKS